MEQVFYGYCEDPNSNKAEYEPPRDAPCPYCGKPITKDDVRTHSLMYTESSYAKRSYFYRTHRTCDEAAPAATSPRMPAPGYSTNPESFLPLPAPHGIPVNTCLPAA